MLLNGAYLVETASVDRLREAVASCRTAIARSARGSS